MKTVSGKTTNVLQARKALKEKKAKKADEEFRKKMDKSLPDKLNSQLTVTDYGISIRMTIEAF